MKICILTYDYKKPHDQKTALNDNVRRIDYMNKFISGYTPVKYEKINYTSFDFTLK